MNNIIEISSKGLYSSWCYHKPTRTLFDCGEGFATYQGNYIYGIERVMLSHGHGDHVLGLPSLIGCRNSARGDRGKPLDIYYPAGDKLVESVRNFCSIRNTKLSFPLRWIPITMGHMIKITDTISIQSFHMEHQKRGLTLGYRILEDRKKLKAEFEGKNIPELLHSGAVSKADLSFDYQQNVFTYCLDSFSLINLGNIYGSDLVVMDCTFLKDSDRDDMTHYTLEEAYNDCKEANVKHMIAAHFSPRYLYPQIRDAVDALNKDHGSKYITPVYHNAVTEV